jgi:hypothetical protein
MPEVQGSLTRVCVVADPCLREVIGRAGLPTSLRLPLTALPFVRCVLEQVCLLQVALPFICDHALHFVSHCVITVILAARSCSVCLVASTVWIR